MPPIPRLVSGAVEKAFFRPVTIVTAKRIGQRFRLVHLRGDGLKGVKSIPGQAVQINIGNLVTRTYTPMDLDPHNGSAHFLIYLHGDGPGSRWASSLSEGDTCLVMRPKRSLDFRAVNVPTLFFGDETSLAASQAFQSSRAVVRHNHYVFEATSLAEARHVVREFDLLNVTLIQKSDDGGHLREVASTLMGKGSGTKWPCWFFTGKATSIQSIRKYFRASQFHPLNSHVKAYWSPGKTGLD
jgi:ferric-chelate reductase (NADPH)